MINKIKEHWPLILGIVFLWINVFLVSQLSLTRNQGHLVYVLDDTYIHMAMAKNFALHGSWGINSNEFTSTSSSILYTLLLSFFYFVFGVNEITPFVINITFATIILITVYKISKNFKTINKMNFGLQLGIIFLLPFCPIIFTGMEHTIQIALSLLFVYFSAKVITMDATGEKWSLSMNDKYLLLLTPLVTMVRFEGAFLVLIVGILLLIRKRIVYSFAMGALGILPILAYGLISISKGWFILPNSVLLKNNVVDTYGYFSSIPLTFSFPLIGFIILALIILFFQYKKEQKLLNEMNIWIIIFIPASILHIVFARPGGFYRYDAYLLAIGMIPIFIGGYKIVQNTYFNTVNDSLNKKDKKGIEKGQIKKFIVITIILIILLAYGARGIRGSMLTLQASTNIYEQQYQMGSFLQKYYDDDVVAVNDIGAVNYLADIECVDLWGLANINVTNLMRDGEYDTQDVYNITKLRDVKIAILFKTWFISVGGLPQEWILVGEWNITNNVVCWGNTVSFYAVDPQERDNLIVNLREFSTKLPDTVEESGLYTL